MSKLDTLQAALQNVLGDKIKRLPFIGVRLESHLAAKVRRAQDMKKKVPGVFTALVMYLFSVWRVLQVKRMKRLALCDRL